MVVENKLGTETDPDIIETGGSIEVIPEKSRQEQLDEAMAVLVTDEGVLIDDEITALEEIVESDFNANLAETLDNDTSGS